MKSKWRQILYIMSILLPVSGCGGNPPSVGKLKEAMDSRNRPQDISGATKPLNFHLLALPESGQSEHRVWTGNWWPLSEGGVAHRSSPDELSPLEKYDQVAQQGLLATDWERKQAERFGHVSWAGHCNGLAAAGINTHEPKHGVSFRGVYFSTEDIKGLLVETWQGGGRIIGGRCNKRSLETDAQGRVLDASCRSLNPGTFHVVLGNFLGIFRKPFIIDKQAAEQVWNYPVVSYQVEESRELSLAEATTLLDLSGSPYVYNPAALYFMYYRTEITLATGQRLSYEYVIEGDAQGYVIGGEWLGESRQHHPDFAWRIESPRTENPYVDSNLVRMIYRKSIE